MIGSMIETISSFLSLLGEFFGLLHVANATHLSGGGIIPILDPLAGCGWDCVANRIIDGLGIISTAIVTIMVLFGGFQIMTAAGDPEKIKTGKHTIFYAVVGFIILLFAGGITVILRNLFS